MEIKQATIYLTKGWGAVCPVPRNLENKEWKTENILCFIVSEGTAEFIEKDQFVKEISQEELWTIEQDDPDVEDVN